MKQIITLLFGLTLLFMMTVVFANSVIDDLSENVIRLHIIANSNSDTDQEIKLKIRDEILCADIKIADRKTSVSNLQKIEHIANTVLRNNGFSYGAKANFGYFKFPEKSYDSFTLPEGKYNGIKVVLGDGNGENWWCILSPPACLIDGTVKFDDTPLKNRLNDNTYKVISGNFKYKSKILEIVNRIF